MCAGKPRPGRSTSSVGSRVGLEGEAGGKDCRLGAGEGGVLQGKGSRLRVWQRVLGDFKRRYRVSTAYILSSRVGKVNRRVNHDNTRKIK